MREVIFSYLANELPAALFGVISKSNIAPRGRGRIQSSPILKINEQNQKLQLYFVRLNIVGFYSLTYCDSVTNI